MKKQFHINILEQEFSVLSDSGDEHVANVVQYVNEKVCEISEATHNINSLNIAILVALNIADEYLKMKRANKDIVNQLEGRSEQLIRLIDTAC